MYLFNQLLLFTIHSIFQSTIAVEFIMICQMAKHWFCILSRSFCIITIPNGFFCQGRTLLTTHVRGVCSLPNGFTSPPPWAPMVATSTPLCQGNRLVFPPGLSFLLPLQFGNTLCGLMKFLAPKPNPLSSSFCIFSQFSSLPKIPQAF